MSLEKIARDFRLGYKIANEACQDRLNPQNPKYPVSLHNQRIDASMNNSGWEGAGFLVGIAKFYVLHPKYLAKDIKNKDN